MANTPPGKFFFSVEKSSLPSIDEAMAEAVPCSPLASEEELPQPEESTAHASGAKPKVSRTQFSIFQKVALENSFHASLYLTGVERDALAYKLGLSPTTVQTWFKNRRFKWRKEIKMADGAPPEPAIAAPPPFLYPSTPPLSFWHTCVGPEHQHPEGSLCGCCGGRPTHQLYANKTHW